MTINIPVFWALFPITFPILLVRVLLATICAIIVSPITFVTWLNETDASLGFGWKASYKVLNRVQKEHKNYSGITVREVLIYAGWILRIVGIRSQEVKIYTLGVGISSTWCYSNGELIPTHVRNSIEKKESLSGDLEQKERGILRRSKCILELDS